jgi:DNA-binding NarL/FixJ family response regulator
MTAVTLPRPGSALLADRDRALIAMLADGVPSKQAARSLGVSPAAVDLWVRRLMAATGTANRTHLVATALRCGWLDDGALEVAA